MKNRVAIKTTTNAEISEYELLYAHLSSLIKTVSELSKKKQDEVMNSLKVVSINKVLQRIIDLIREDPSVEFIQILDEVTLPTNSDAMLTLNQFQTALENFKKMRYSYTGLEWEWNVED